MLQLTGIRKSYTTADFTQTALDDVSVSFRDNEFVAVLGPSGSGKTTMLNIIGGLDHYDDGDLEIDGISTKEYNSRDWDTYRNNRIGFVFQSYNLIPHQSILANVELALTLSGVSATERRERAIQALEEVGLGDHIRKKPNQLSGGQMQRVAIARALINDPEILLADEPTGALDTKTSTQVMDLLTKIAKKRLVIMVTHNSELAENYANRIIILKDGQIKSDTRPFHPSEEDYHTGRQARKASMSFLTAISLSFSNLMTKKGRTFVTALAGSIGIIGIAAIMSLANGINVYIEDIERETLSIYPLTISESGFDLDSLYGDFNEILQDDTDIDEDVVYEQQIVDTLFSSQSTNDLGSLKSYLDEKEEELDPYVNSLQYTYGITPQIFLADTSDGIDQVNPDSILNSYGFGSADSMSALLGMGDMMSMSSFSEMPGDLDMFEHQYEVMTGRWPESYDEVVLVVNSDGSVSDYVLYMAGLRDRSELRNLMDSFINQTDYELPESDATITYDSLMETEFRVINPADQYQYDEEYDIWLDKSNDEEYMETLVEEGMALKIVGIVKPDADATANALSAGINYTPELISHLMEEAAQSEIVQDQMSRPDINVLTGVSFAEENEETEDPAFDLADIISIDEDAITEAFGLDPDDLGMDLSGMDITDMFDDFGDLGDLSIDPGALDLDGLDMSGFNIDPSDMDLPEFDMDLDELTRAIANDVNIPADQLNAIMVSVLENFIREEIANGVTDLEQIPEDLQRYLARSDVQNEINSQLASFIDSSAMEEQIMRMLEVYMQDAMQTYMNQMTASLENYLQSYLEALMETTMDTYMNQIMDQLESQLTSGLEAQSQQLMDQLGDELASQFEELMDFDLEDLADSFEIETDEDELLALLTALMNPEESTYERNLSTFGYADPDVPSTINIYPMDFQAKEEIIALLDEYNAQAEADGEPERVVRYTDIVGVMMSSITDIINTISYALIAFVSISLVVSSIMIGVITYISVLERKKEIGILRALGASRQNIRQVFNAETLIIGFVSGLLGIVVTLLLCIPANIIVENLVGIEKIAQLPTVAGFGLIAISMLLTFVAGLFPASAAARKDPVEALRSE